MVDGEKAFLLSSPCRDCFQVTFLVLAIGPANHGFVCLLIKSGSLNCFVLSPRRLPSFRLVKKTGRSGLAPAAAPPLSRRQRTADCSCDYPSSESRSPVPGRGGQFQGLLLGGVPGRLPSHACLPREQPRAYRQAWLDRLEQISSQTSCTHVPGQRGKCG